MDEKIYYLGLDIGTDSVGWAVANSEYKLNKFRGNAMWGVRMFDESDTAVSRRGFRCASRRLFRRKQRIEWLQMLFDREISKVDIAFFNRLKESNLYAEDKTINSPYAVFADENYNDTDFHNEYKTIYHLRKELIENDEPHDIRLVYLALHHIIKHRGHFLFDSIGENIDSYNSFETLFQNLKDYLAEEYLIEVECNNEEEFASVIKDKMLSKTKKEKAVYSLCGITKKENPNLAAVLYLLCGGTVKLADLFGDPSFNDGELKSITFSGSYDDKEPDYQDLLNERYELIEKAKAIYDWAILDSIRKGNKYISFAKADSYDEHKSDLKMLKEFVRKYCNHKYNRIFRETKTGLDNYTAYSGKYKSDGHNGVILCRTNQEDFCKFLSKELKEYRSVDENYDAMFQKIENQVFMPKQITKDNGVVPMQLNRMELKKILENASKYLDFLNNEDSDGMSVKDKIVKIFEYHIPYYVGPLNTNSDKSWLIRSEEKIYPWNFEKVVDIEKSAEEFINNLTSKCTYLRDKDVIPKKSILYSKYMVLNELNNLKVNGEKLDVKLKQDIFNKLFLVRKKVTLKAVRDYIKSVYGSDVELTGIDMNFRSSMSSYIDLHQYNLTVDEMEDVIFAITIFGDDKKLLKNRLRKQLGDKLSVDEIKRISQLKYKDWAAFSREFLTEIYDVSLETGEVKDNIINTLWNSQDNLMELLGSKYNFSLAIENANENIDAHDTLEDMVNSLYVSPKVKRPVYQSLKIVNEIIKIMGCKPKKIFVEMTRSDGIKGDKGRKDSRKDRLVKLYQACGRDSGELFESLQSKSFDELRRDKLYLYYTQFGRCMYSGEEISIDDLMEDKNTYDIDHIFPRSKVKDDSLDNRVLVKKQINAHKDNDYPLNRDIQNKMRSHWSFLCAKGLISKKKYERLTRVTPLTDSELSDFIARQLVETGQSTKAVAELFKVMYPSTEVVYVKASTVSDFRHQYEMLKCRSVNDLHHAKDAYLNIVVGNVYNVKYTHNRRIFIKGLQTKKYSLNRMFNYSTEGAWVAEEGKSISIVKRTMRKNNILVTRYASVKSGELFKLNPLKKGKGQVPLKKNTALSDISKYGGYDRPGAAYFAFVKHLGKKDKEIRQMVPINMYQRANYESNPEKYLTEVLGLKSPQILIPVVKYNSCIEIDGFRMHISSKKNEGATLAYKPAVQLIIGERFERYIKKIEKLMTKPEDYKITKYDEISEEMNIALYSELVYKLTSTVFKVKFGSIGDKLKNAQDKYVGLTLWEQCYVISEVLKIIHNNVLTGDLRLVGGSKKTGATTTNSALSEIKNISKIYLVNQSVTGLYENKVDLLNM